ncbi:MAG: hypothetical protein NT034_00675 [Candidatus Magasanikbacteria bacterium]|nr:hypothetical protein [Candidatus Magasanikbacteria bacterium]
MFAIQLPDVTPFYQRVLMSLASVSLGAFASVILKEVFGAPTTNKICVASLVLLVHVTFQAIAFLSQLQMERYSQKLGELSEVYQPRLTKVHLAFCCGVGAFALFVAFRVVA